MATHELKTWPEPFQALLEGHKTHEIRSCEDRDFEVGDELLLREWEPANRSYTSREVTVEVTYVTPAEQWGLPSNLCVLSVQLKSNRGTRRILSCVDCSAEYVEPYIGASRYAGWETYREYNENGKASPILTLCPRCQDKPFKFRFFKRPVTT